MTAYEYRLVSITHYDISEINRLAAKGWRVVSVTGNFALMERSKTNG